MPLVIKLGGAAVDDPASAGELLGALAEHHRRHPAGVVLVHGGGAAVDRHLARIGAVTQRREGIRVTPPEMIDEVVSVLAGTVNTRLVGALLRRGARAVGLGLGDGGAVHTVRTRRYAFDAGQVGEVAGGDPSLLRGLLAGGFMPVMCSIGFDADGAPLNVNADEAAAGVARLLGASTLVLLTDVPGVLDRDGRVVPALRCGDVESWIADGRITGGMIAKVRSAAEAALAAAAPVTIASWKQPATLTGGTEVRP